MHYTSVGYEIERIGDALWLVNRGLWPVGMAIGVVSAGALLCLGTGIGSLVAHGRVDVTGVACLSGAALAFGILSRLMAAYRTRRNRPLVRIENAVVIDTCRGVLRTPQGEPLTGLSSIEVAVRIAWWDGSRGLMRNVLLSWPGGRRVVFKTANRGVAREVAMTLHAQLLRPRGRGLASRRGEGQVQSGRL